MSSEDGVLGELNVPVPGKHNALNALAAVVAGMTAGLDFQTCTKGIAEFQGVDRRFQAKGESKEVKFFDDYGHHPTEVQAVLSAFKDGFPSRRLVVLFQPHRYSRTQLCWEQFLESFSDADKLFVTDIYPAGEAVIQGVSSELMVKQMEHPQVSYLNAETDEGQQIIVDSLKADDVFVTLGAGNVWKIGETIQNLLQEKS